DAERVLLRLLRGGRVGRGHGRRHQPGSQPPHGAVRSDGPDRARYDAVDPGGHAPRFRRPQVPPLPPAAPVRRGGLAGAQERPRLLPLRGDGVSPAPSAARALVSREGAIALVTINRPEARNALDGETFDAIGEAFVQAERDPQVRCAILMGAGDKAFAAGADIKAMADADPSGADVLVGHAHRLADRLEASRLPVIAAVHGFALGGGLELALACDFIFAARGAKLGFPEVGLGVIPGMGGTQRLARRIGVPRTRELIYRGALIDADEAMRLGFVNAVL